MGYLFSLRSTRKFRFEANSLDLIGLGGAPKFRESKCQFSPEICGGVPEI